MQKLRNITVTPGNVSYKTIHIDEETASLTNFNTRYFCRLQLHKIRVCFCTHLAEITQQITM